MAVKKKPAASAKKPAAPKPGVTWGTGTPDDPWILKTPPGTSEYQAWRDEAASPPALVVQVGSTRLSKTSTRQFGCSPSTPKRSTIAGMPISTRAKSPGLSKISTKPSNSSRISMTPM